MSFKDGQDVQSLLALLRDTSTTTQDNSNRHNHTLPVPATHPTPQLPSRQQLDSLLLSLSTPAVPSPPKRSAFDGPSGGKDLFEPFGIQPGPARIPSQTNLQGYSSRGDGDTSERANGGMQSGNTRSPKRAKTDDSEWRDMGFSKALPILTDLIGQPVFQKEVKKLKADQDALERRMWAKGEKIKADHERSMQAERDISRITRRPIPLEKREEMAETLRLDLRDFYLKTVLPSIDDMASRHRIRLEELGVPGLGGEGVLDDKEQMRVKRIMDVIEAAMEE